MNTSTIKNLTDGQIITMQSDAETACDYVMAAICDLAIIGTFDADDWSTLTPQEQVRVGNMTRKDAYQVIVDAHNAVPRRPLRPLERGRHGRREESRKIRP